MANHLPLSVRVPIDTDNPSITRNESLCVNCGLCKEVCSKYIGIHGTYTLEQTCGRAVCIHCGQCANVCPTGSITEVFEYPDVKNAIKDPDKIVIVSTSPSVRVALGEEFNMPKGSFVQGKMVALLRALGADYVLDTNFAADLTIVEEASELIQRITKKDKPLPQFTSCCPAWVKYAEIYHPELLPNISSAKSPIGMQGPTIKTYFAQKMGIDPAKIVNVALTPCTAKKFEIRREEMNAAGRMLDIPDMRDMDHVITTRELSQWAKEDGIDLNALEDSSFDRLMGEASGAGVIFGNTGGVMEAALRTAYAFITGERPPQTLFELQPVRGYEGIREASLMIKDLTVNIAVVYGTANVSELIRRMKSSKKEYHFIEVMTCPGGCIGGGGQPKDIMADSDKTRQARINSLYQRDAGMEKRLSHENAEILQLYKEFYGEPLSELAESMLHTVYTDRSSDIQPVPAQENTVSSTPASKWVCSVCGYVHEGSAAPEVCPICKVPAEKFVAQGGEKTWAAEHVVGVAQGVPEDIIMDLRANFEGECSEVGMYLAMARVAHREGYPEIGLYWEKAAWEEAEHAAKFAELLGEVVTASTKKNLELRVDAENGATAGKFDLAKRAKELNLDAIHDTVHEMARDEARHGKAFEGLLKRFFTR